MFRITNGKGFHMTFENGVTVSVQFGWGNYCENRDRWNLRDKKENIESKNAEIAIWDKDENWITKKYIAEVLKEKAYDDVKGYLTTEQVLEAINWASKYEIK